MEQILLLMSAATYTDADRALYSARDMALRPERLSFGLSLREEPTEEEMEAMLRLGNVQFLCPAYDSWQGVLAVWEGESHILMGHPGMVFAPRWDADLLRDLKRCQSGRASRAVLTGYLPRSQDPVDAVCPVAADAFDANGMLLFHRGTPLRYARSAQPAAFVHPDFCFGPAAFFREPTEEQEPYFLRAFRNHWSVYTACKPRIRLLWDDLIPPCDIRGCEEGRRETVRPFEQRFGLRFAKRQLSPMARQGIFNEDMTYPMRVPLTVKTQEIFRGLTSRADCTPLCVTACLTLPYPSPNLPEEYLSWFKRLIAIRNLALLCYADSETIRKISPIHPNVLEYKRRYSLQTESVVGPDEALNYIKLSKPFLLGATREKFLTHSHYVWMDFGCLRYPVYEHAWLDWESICTDRIVLATVGGVPDLSMLVVPERLVRPLCKEIADRCARETGRLPQETTLWKLLIHDKPEWFDLRPLPGVRELFTLLTTARGEEHGTVG